MYVKLYKIKCLTNMHVGNGDVNFNVIDNEVEKDPITDYPTINASGVKGAIRQHFEDLGVETDKIFGRANKADEAICPGSVKFFSADLLARPMRVSKGNAAYALVTTKTALEHLKNLANALGLGTPDISTEACETIEVEDIVSQEKTGNILGERYYVISDEAFKTVPLPVLVRNCLEGKGNLWYEEVVPHETVMYFFATSLDKNAFDTFTKTMHDAPIIQFGGNASIGYGMCKLEEVSAV